MHRTLLPALSACLCLFFLGALLPAALDAAPPKVPWQRRIGRNVEIQHKRQHERVRVDMWPAEPASPTPVSPERFAQALQQLCGTLTEARAADFSQAIVADAAAFGVDPFALGALIYDQSRCLPKQPGGETERMGLSRIDVAMHAPHIRQGAYQYWRLQNEQWVPEQLSADRHPFNRWRAAAWRSNIYWTSAILAVYTAQSPDLARAFPTTPFRHPLSHWFFGDNVRATEPEDRVLTARRRLLQYYRGDPTDTPIGEVLGVPIVSPLDGAPRLVLDDFGNKRGLKHGPGHQGMDLVAANGEPVRAMADGRVVFAGTDLPGRGSQSLTIAESVAFDRRQMGKGGLYVMIRHSDAFRTAYMHLDSIAVEERATVRAGDLIGTAGRTGARESGNHLHLEFRTPRERLDPALYMGPALVDPKRAATPNNPSESESP
ncbi:MAG: M23 family metallopeptidase [Proteobacteria bacterium]|nr:M23 family metallopeptidase [Pseudomonadota bacterium]